MPDDGGSPGADIVDKFVAINIICIGPLYLIKDDRIASDRRKCSYRRADPSRHKLRVR